MRDPDVRDPDGGVAPTAPRGILPGARGRRRWTAVPVEVEPSAEPPPRVRYQWDTDTEILAVSVEDARGGGAAATSLELEGKDGSWITLELRAGRFVGLEIAVWPTVRLRSILTPPGTAESGHVVLPGLQALGGAADVEVDTVLACEADRARRTMRLRFGRPREVRAIRAGRDILVEVDGAGELAGLWLLNVPALSLLH